MIELQPTTSRAFSHIGYDEPAKELHVRMHSGDRYAYGNFTPTHWRSLMLAESQGRHFASHIKTSMHPARKISE